MGGPREPTRVACMLVASAFTQSLKPTISIKIINPGTVITDEHAYAPGAIWGCIVGLTVLKPLGE
eukprot:3549765-Pyramimonas_sp.AAC.1